MFNAKAFAAILTESRFMLLTNSYGFAVKMISAFHLFLSSTCLFFNRFETGRGLSKT
jgi:hypothetical protein